MVEVASAHTDRFITGASFHSASSAQYPSDSEVMEQAQQSRGDTDLNYFHALAQIEEQLTVGEFTKVRGLSDCCRADGKVELHRWTAKAGVSEAVVVKRVTAERVNSNRGKEPCEKTVHRLRSVRNSEDCLTEIGVYCYLRQQQDVPQYILRMHTVFAVGTDIWLVLDHAEGGDLFSVVQNMRQDESKTPEALHRLMLWTWQLLQAVCYLHRHRVGHRDISMENVLLTDGVVRLMDFGQAVQTQSLQGHPLRYYSALGKPYYRPPECYIPTQDVVDVVTPLSACPGQVAFARTVDSSFMCEVLLPACAQPGQKCSAEPVGYTVPAVDVFACGVCLFIMATGVPPWRTAMLSDGHFAWVHSKGAAALLRAWKKQLPPEAENLLVSTLSSDPSQRPTADACLAHPWFSALSGVPVAMQQTSPLSPDVPPSACALSPSTSAGSTTASEGASGHSSLSDAEVALLTGQPLGAPAGDAYASADFGGSSCPGAASGDFYRFDGMDSLGPKRSDESLHVGVSDVPPPPADLTGACGPLGDSSLEVLPFEECHVPPRRPQDGLFKLEPTTFHVSANSPLEVGNHLLFFLATVVGASVRKVDRQKFTIKADVDGAKGTCTLKVRVYAEDGGYAVEFQRRNGDSMALNLVYQQALKSGLSVIAEEGGVI
eukprot:gnl/TRDRNA2_/TRDRNA2_41698_c0_seq1.p1 gnl/TRDRNA2_/TRDRNA2_41698_c0~~gnl/TRDRNA2_/TRDRNA2_41698_c0_seq1.p1  ORF type:complete len:659 (+),score=115.33 gnl/TRDRNA2_/TRDRNA2_41698_c0_seq1:64-2040(+)